MLWIRLPVEDDECDLMPLSRRHQISVYDRVIVSDLDTVVVVAGRDGVQHHMQIFIGWLAEHPLVRRGCWSRARRICGCSILCCHGPDMSC
jgi:hypothetical protein